MTRSGRTTPPNRTTSISCQRFLRARCGAYRLTDITHPTTHTTSRTSAEVSGALCRWRVLICRSRATLKQTRAGAYGPGWPLPTERKKKTPGKRTGALVRTDQDA